MEVSRMHLITKKQHNRYLPRCQTTVPLSGGHSGLLKACSCRSFQKRSDPSSCPVTNMLFSCHSGVGPTAIEVIAILQNKSSKGCPLMVVTNKLLQATIQSIPIAEPTSSALTALGMFTTQNRRCPVRMFHTTILQSTEPDTTMP